MKKKTNIIIITLATGIMVTTVVLAAKMLKQRRTKFERQEIADEGYEFAHDILFPLKSQLRKVRQR